MQSQNIHETLIYENFTIFETLSKNLAIHEIHADEIEIEFYLRLIPTLNKFPEITKLIKLKYVRLYVPI